MLRKRSGKDNDMKFVTGILLACAVIAGYALCREFDDWMRDIYPENEWED